MDLAMIIEAWLIRVDQSPFAIQCNMASIFFLQLWILIHGYCLPWASLTARYLGAGSDTLHACHWLKPICDPVPTFDEGVCTIPMQLGDTFRGSPMTFGIAYMWMGPLWSEVYKNLHHGLKVHSKVMDSLLAELRPLQGSIRQLAPRPFAIWARLALRQVPA